MRALLLGLAAVAVIAVAASFVLPQLGFGSAERQSSPAVRLD
jgi:hypothetical protein